MKYFRRIGILYEWSPSPKCRSKAGSVVGAHLLSGFNIGIQFVKLQTCFNLSALFPTCKALKYFSGEIVLFCRLYFLKSSLNWGWQLQTVCPRSEYILEIRILERPLIFILVEHLWSSTRIPLFKDILRKPWRNSHLLPFDKRSERIAKFPLISLPTSNFLTAIAHICIFSLIELQLRNMHANFLKGWKAFSAAVKRLLASSRWFLLLVSISSQSLINPFCAIFRETKIAQ